MDTNREAKTGQLRPRPASDRRTETPRLFDAGRDLPESGWRRLSALWGYVGTPPLFAPFRDRAGTVSGAMKEPNVGEEELFELEIEFMEAVKGRDMAYLDRTLGDNFVLTTGRAGAEIRSRQEWLEVTRESYRIESFEFEWVRVEAYGDAAVVRSRYRQKAALKGMDRTGAYLMTDVWVRLEGTWLLVTRHVSPLLS